MMVSKRRKPQASLPVVDAREAALRAVMEAQKRKTATDAIRLKAQAKRDEAHLHLATRILRYKFSFVPMLTYEDLADKIGIVDASKLNLVTLRYKYFSDEIFRKIEFRLCQMETEAGLLSMPQTLIEGG